MLGSILNFGSSIFDGLMAGRKAKAKAKAEVTIAKGKAEAEALLAASKDLAAWERIQAQASAISWKDEAWTVFFIGMLSFRFVAVAFLPASMADSVEAAYKTIEGVFSGMPGIPDGQHLLGYIISVTILASFGIRMNNISKMKSVLK